MMPIKNEQFRKIKKKHETKYKLRTGGAAKYKLGLVPDAMARAGVGKHKHPLKIGVLKNFVIFVEKYLCWNLFL